MPGDFQPLNLARIVHRLQASPRGWAVDDLLDELEISKRTYRKYRLNLQRYFTPWQQAGESRLEEVREGERRYLRLREPRGGSGEILELVQRLSAFWLAGQVLGFLGDDELGTALDVYGRAVGQEGQRRFPLTFSRLLGHMDRLFFSLPDAPKDYRGQEAKLGVLIGALVHLHPVRFAYAPARGERAEHEVEPLSLALFRGGLYLLARYPGRERVYNFAVDRIEGPEVGARYFAYPEPEDYDPRSMYRGAFGIFVEQDRDALDVELVFADVKWLKVYVREREWQQGQELEELDDGRLRLRFSVTSLVEVVPWVLRFGGDVEVVGPPELVAAVADARGAG